MGSVATEIAEAENSYAMQFYGLLIVTALAYGSAGTTDAAQSAEHVRTVSMAPGKTVHT